MKDFHISRQQGQAVLHVGQDLRLKAGFRIRRQDRASASANSEVPFHLIGPLLRGNFYLRYSSRSRRTASLAGFFDLSHTLDGPLRYDASTRFETMPSSPMRHA
jgi:hypothetical protein